MSIFTTSCPRNCYSTCSMLVTVENNRIVRIDAHPDNEATQAGVCLKGLSYVERQASSKRITEPMKRISSYSSQPAFEKISWEEAIDLIARKLIFLRDVYGPQTVFYYAASGTKGWLNRIGARFWRLFGGYTGIYGDLCWPAGLEASRLTLGDNKHNLPWDIAQSRLLIMWGKNPAETNVQQMRFIGEAQSNGAQLVVIDPRRTETALKADLHIQPKPGTDGALALGIGYILIQHNWIDQEFIDQNVLGYPDYVRLVEKYNPEFVAETCGIPINQIELLAGALGSIKPATINAGYGMQRYTNGGQTIRALIALCAITGNIGKPGSGWIYANLQSHIFDPVKDPLDSYPPNKPDGVARISISTAKLGYDMLSQVNPPLQFLWIERGNPVAQNPETNKTIEAIRHLNYRVVVEEVMTDTALEADLILPAKTLFEQTDVITAYWHSYIQVKQKIVEQPEHVLPETEIYWRLALKLGYTEAEILNAGIPHPGETEKLLSSMLASMNDHYGSSITLEKLEAGPVLAPTTQPIAFEDLQFSTPSGKIELFSEEAARRWNVDPLPAWSPPLENSVSENPNKSRFPLQMMTPNNKNSIHSQFHNLDLIKQVDPGARLSMNSIDAADRKLQADDLARVYNDRGQIILPVFIDDGLRSGCVSCPNGYWHQHGSGVNVLSAARETDMGYGAAFHDNLVQVEKWRESRK